MYAYARVHLTRAKAIGFDLAAGIIRGGELLREDNMTVVKVTNNSAGYAILELGRDS